MAGRAHEGEAAAPRGLDRRPCRKARRLERRRRRNRVAVEPRWLRDRPDEIDVLARVYKEKLVVGRRATLAPYVLVLEQDGQPLRPLGMVAGRMQARERGVAQDVDRTISASASTSPPARPSR
jgi:hypothetical protein